MGYFEYLGIYSKKQKSENVIEKATSSSIKSNVLTKSEYSYEDKILVPKDDELFEFDYGTKKRNLIISAILKELMLIIKTMKIFSKETITSFPY